MKDGGKVSNHSGSYMLNDVISILRKYKVFNSLSDIEKRKLTDEILDIGDDTNSGEILEGHELFLGICGVCCKEDVPISQYGLCEECEKDNDHTDCIFSSNRFVEEEKQQLM